MLDQAWLSAFLPVGRLESSGLWSPFGAGTLFGDGKVIWIVTAAHVVKKAADGIAPLVNLRSGETTAIDLTGLHRKTGLGWILDDQNDLAASLFPVNPEFQIKTVSQDNCARLADILPSMTCLTAGCPYGIPGFDQARPAPLVLDGIVAGIDQRAKRIYVTAPTFPGNSGGPVLLIKQLSDPYGHTKIGSPTVFFGGVILEYLVHRVKEPAEQADLPPLHLGVAAPGDAVLDLLDSDASKRQVAIAFQAGKEGAATMGTESR